MDIDSMLLGYKGAEFTDPHHKGFILCPYIPCIPMKSKDFSCSFHMPKALKGSSVHSLPPAAPQPTYLVDDYPDAPASWVRSTGKIASYFVGISEGHGMWLDFNGNLRLPHDTAVLISVQGVNPLDGQKASPALSKYDRCPVHGDELRASDKVCPTCGFAWPAQNFLSSKATPQGQFWLDGFRSADGQTKQFLFTAEEMRGVAAQVIGEQRSFAIGIAFFKGPQRDNGGRGGLRHYLDHIGITNNAGEQEYCGDIKTVGYSGGATLCSTGGSGMMKGGDSGMLKLYDSGVERTRGRGVMRGVQTKSLEIAAGASIHQHVWGCSLGLDQWGTEPEAVIYINYAPKEQVEDIVKTAPQISGGSFLANLKSGND